MSSLSSSLKSVLKKNLPILTKLLGTVLLTKEQTEHYLHSEAENVFSEKGIELTLPEIMLLTTEGAQPSEGKQLFSEKHITTGAAFIWKYQNTNLLAKQLRNGSIAINNKVLDIGFGNRAVAKDMLKRNPRASRSTKILIAPWSHYWTGYFDYIFFVGLTICRIKEQLSAEEFAEAIVCYPVFNLGFESQLLDLLGVKRENVVDSRQTNVAFETCYIGNTDSWFYPNKQNVILFKREIERKVVFEEGGPARIYMQRAGRRKILNEAGLLVLLAKYDIEVIADIPRSIAEQVNIYRNASFIIGPHGASFANILWCRPGAQLVELFPNQYMPEYFRYLTRILDLEYAAYCQGQPMGNEHSHVDDDVSINLDEIEHYLQVLLK